MMVFASSPPDSVEIRAIPPNAPPIANAGPDQQVTTGNSVSLNGSASKDPDGDAITYLWSLSSKPPQSALSDDGIQGRTLAIASFIPDVDGLYVVQLIVNDGIAGSSPDLVEVRAISPNAPPSVNAGGPYTVNEGGSVILSASGSDPEGAPLAYAWDLDNNGAFEPPGQTVAFSAAGLDGPSAYAVAVRVTDAGGLMALSSTTIHVLNVAPPVGAITIAPESDTHGCSGSCLCRFYRPGNTGYPHCVVDLGRWPDLARSRE